MQAAASPRSRSGRAAASRGSALLVTILLTATFGLLGVCLLALADAEMRIAAFDRDAEQLLHTAESGLRLVKAWFDQPVTGDPAAPGQVLHRLLGGTDLRDPSLFDRTRRLIDADGDPNTPPVLADGSAARPYYRQGRELWAPSAHLDLFHKPYRGDATTTFLGDESGPDLLVEDRAGVVDFLDRINALLFTDQLRTGRIEEIAIYAPPGALHGGAPRRLGVCTIRVKAVKYRHLGAIGSVPVVTTASVPVAERTVSAVLNELPAVAADGPLESCGDLEAGGALRARWGRVVAGGDVTLSADLDAHAPSAFPFKTFSRRISGSGPGSDFDAWASQPDDTIEDPWLQIVASGTIAGQGAAGDQPFPYVAGTPVDVDHTNLFQRVAGASCGVFDYALYKSAASSGGRTSRYLTFDRASGLFREWGVGPARSVRDWTHGEEGLFFFDTIDGLPPNGLAPGDPNSNLTPAVVIENGDWNLSGLLYLNSASVRIANVAGASRVVIPPGEPFDDADGDGDWDPGEAFVNLRYPLAIVVGAPGSEFIEDPNAAQAGSATSPDLERYLSVTTTGRDGQGLPILGEVNLFGVLYNAGDVVAEGAATHFGSVIAGHAVVQATPGAVTPEILFDERLNTGAWPPAEIAFPRTFFTLWVDLP